MRVLSTFNDKINQDLARVTGLEIVDKMPADVFLVARRTKLGGVDDPQPYIAKPQATLVMAGRDDQEGMAFAKKAVSCGVPKSNVKMYPEGVRLTLQALAEELKKLADSLEETDLLGSDIGECSEVPTETGITRRKDKLIAFYAVKNGVGKTTLACATASHYKDIGERVAVVDLNLPCCAPYHFGKSLTENKSGLLFTQTDFGDLYAPQSPFWEQFDKLKEIREMQVEYGRVIVILPPVLELLETVNPDKTVIVVNSDLIQVLDPTARDGLEGVYVYNEVTADIDPEEVCEMFRQRVVAVKPDPDGCNAALAGGMPANMKSEYIARAVGELAALIDEGR